MGEILGLGCTHYPGLTVPEERLPASFHRLLTAPGVPDYYKDKINWPAELVAELGNDQGYSAAQRYGSRMADDFRAIRAALDAFDPDVVLVWGDDQYENFREDIIPAFCILGLDDDFAVTPWQTNGHGGAGGKPNRWGEPADWALNLHGHREAVKYLATGLIERGIDTAYAYKPLHHPLAHAFTNTLLYLDWDRRGFPYPVIPFAINCYGSNLLHAQGGSAALFMPPRDQSTLPDPPSPQPWRCMAVGKAVAEVFAASPWRVALIASSSWSHCFLSPTNGYLWPDHAADRLLFDAISGCDYDTWRKHSRKDMEQAGQHEMLNWMALMGAMETLHRRPKVQDYVETHIFMSNKCFVSYPV
jgi:hypothetical protein